MSRCRRGRNVNRVQAPAFPQSFVRFPPRAHAIAAENYSATQSPLPPAPGPPESADRSRSPCTLSLPPGNCRIAVPNAARTCAAIPENSITVFPLYTFSIVKPWLPKPLRHRLNVRVRRPVLRSKFLPVSAIGDSSPNFCPAAFPGSPAAPLPAHRSASAAATSASWARSPPPRPGQIQPAPMGERFPPRSRVSRCLPPPPRVAAPVLVRRAGFKIKRELTNRKTEESKRKRWLILRLNVLGILFRQPTVPIWHAA